MNLLTTHCPGHFLTGVISRPVSYEHPIQRRQESEYFYWDPGVSLAIGRIEWPCASAEPRSFFTLYCK
jgi:hypothetical protein